MRKMMGSGWTCAAVLAMAVAGVIGLGAARGEDAAASTAAAASAPASAAATMPKVDLRAVVNDVRSAYKELQDMTEVDGTFTDAAKRAEALKKAGPAMDKMLAAAEQVKAVPRMGGLKKEVDIIVETAKAGLGDEALIAAMKEKAAGTGAEAMHAKAVLARGEYLQAGKDEAAQGKVIETFAKLVQEDPTNGDVTYVVVASHNDSATTPKSVDAIEAALKDSKTTEARQAQVQWASERKLNALVNKPLVVKNFKLDGTEFSTESLKGKVVMMDFWATWCGPCVAELPRVTKVYEKYHDKGFEIVSLSFDENVDAINDFLAEHKEITWIQLFNPKTPGWSAGKEWSIMSIPVMFLIDKKGVVRSVHGREEMDTLIPKLLEEDAGK